MEQTRTRKAFTLIELLTVMAIITLLIGILTPALRQARITGQRTAVRAQINAMEVGLEAFTGEEGEYPASNAALYANPPGDPIQMAAWEVGDLAQPLQGAHLLVDALVGRDFLGYDPRRGSTTYNRWDPMNDRRQPFIPVDGVDATSIDEPPEDAFGQLPMGDDSPIQPHINGLVVRSFRDKFGWPILYYRAAPTATQNSPIINTTPGPPIVGNGVYDGIDNALFTSYTGSQHRIDEADQIPTPAQLVGVPSLDGVNNFAEFIRSIRATSFEIPNPDLILQARPVKADRFILLSAGPDGIYGNLDDVANFQVLSTER